MQTIIPTQLIRRFSKMKKREIIVLLSLFASRNRQDGKCQTSRGRISSFTGIAKPHVSAVIKSLAIKGWLTERPSGNFVLIDDLERVIDPVSEGVPLWAGGGTNLVPRGDQTYLHKKHEARSEKIYLAGDEIFKLWMRGVAFCLHVRPGDTIPNFNQWREVLRIAVRENWSFTDFFDDVKTELAENPLFSTPETCLSRHRRRRNR